MADPSPARIDERHDARRRERRRTAARRRVPVDRRRLGDRRGCSLQDEDHRLLLRASDGDGAAWEALVERHAPSVWSRALDLAPDASTAALVSELVWFRLIEQLPRLAAARGLPAWLAATVSDEMDRHLRRCERPQRSR